MTDEQPETQDVQAPYPDALSFHTDKKIGLRQFEDELRAQVGNVLVSMVNDTPFGDAGTIYIVPDTVDQTKVQEVIDNHVYNPQYGVPEYVAEFNDLVSRFQNDPALEMTDEDVRVAIKGLLGRFGLGG